MLGVEESGPRRNISGIDEMRPTKVLTKEGHLRPFVTQQISIF